MEQLFGNAGSLCAAYADVDWGRTGLGPVPSWSPVLRAAVDLVLSTRFPASLMWGPDLVLVYNEAYVPLIADKHPASLGAPAAEVFPEAWDAIGPMFHGVLAGHGAVWLEDALVPLVRHGYLEDCWFTFSYSPVGGTDGRIEGVLDIAADTTRQVVDRRRLELLTRLTWELASVEDVADLAPRVVGVLSSAGDDLDHVEVRIPGQPLASWSSGGEGDRPVTWLPLPAARTGGGAAGLGVVLSDRLGPDADARDVLRLVADSVARALSRLRLLGAERLVAAGESAMAEAVQRSLLTPPLQPDHLEVAVRYVPAGRRSRLGGDWYDSFLLPGGDLALAVGDVTGHDLEAAVAMAQVRNLLRGVASTLDGTPAQVLGGLDSAMRTLAVEVLATAVLARVEQDTADEARGLRTLRWTNAGHPPPVLLEPDGRARLLSTPPEPLLGLLPRTPRTEHEVVLRAGASVLLYTDGLVERRGESLQVGLDRLVAAVDGQHVLAAERLCDHVLRTMAGSSEDDVALLVLRAHPEDAPRPPEAGPEVLPEDLVPPTG